MRTGRLGSPSTPRCPQAHGCRHPAARLSSRHTCSSPPAPKSTLGGSLYCTIGCYLYHANCSSVGLKEVWGHFTFTHSKEKYSSELPPFKLRCSELKACPRAVLFEAAFHLQISWLNQEHEASKPPLCRLRSVPFKGLRKGRTDVRMPAAPAPHLALRHQAGISLVCP